MSQTEKQGIDVSRWQGDIDWEKVQTMQLPPPVVLSRSAANSETANSGAEKEETISQTPDNYKSPRPFDNFSFVHPSFI